MRAEWHKVRHGDELYVYFLGTLIYKRWLGAGYGKVFPKWGLPFSAAEVDGRRLS